MKHLPIYKKLQRKYLPEDLVISDWETIEPYFKESFRKSHIHSKEELEKWFKDMSELEAAVNEDVLLAPDKNDLRYY